jgi:hypothetical protein
VLASRAVPDHESEIIALKELKYDVHCYGFEAVMRTLIIKNA